MTQWIFAEVSPAAVRRDPNETELFKTDSPRDGEYEGTDALVREIIQNSLDAKAGDGPVRVRFALHPHSDMPREERQAAYFSRLKPALQFRQIEFSDDGVPALKQGYLVCEDFGTRGLGGDPHLIKDPARNSDKREDFYWFWRNIGRSGKTGDDLGRWGLGKTVYRAASRVGCMFGLTVRHEDQRQLLMGQAVLKIHTHLGKEYAAEGYWCAGGDPLNTPRVISEPEQIEQFKREWKITRTHESGLSVVAPFVAEELQPEGLARQVIVNFFWPILTGDLVVEVVGGNANQRVEYKIHEGSIEEVCNRLQWDGKQKLKLSAPPPIGFFRKCLAGRPLAVPSYSLGQDVLPELTEDSFENASIIALRDDFQKEKLVAAKIQLYLHQKNGELQLGNLFAFLQKTAEPDRHESYYVREGMTITKLNTSSRVKGVQGLVIVEKGPLASLLGDTEGPSHASWDTSNDERPNLIWKQWKGRVKFCSKILDSLVQLLVPKHNGADFNLLSDVFSIERITAAQPTRRNKPNETGTSTQPIALAEIEPKRAWYKADKIRGGFRISHVNDMPIPPATALVVTVAYDLPSGNPFKRWSVYDFHFKQNLQGIIFEGPGVKPKYRDGNAVVLYVKEGFWLKVTGFDIHRDLVLRIDQEILDEEPTVTSTADEVAS